MATPIEPTPVLQGDDAAELATSLERTAPPAEIARRRRAAADFLRKVSPPASAVPDQKR